MKSKNGELQFYEGLGAIQIYWLIIHIVILIVSSICAIIEPRYFYVPIAVIFIYLLIVLLNYMLAKIFLKKITIGENGITIIHHKNIVFYNIEIIDTLNVEYRKFKEVIFTSQFLIWLIGFCYLTIIMDESKELTILTSKKNCECIKELLKR